MPLTFGIVCFEGCYSAVDDRRISLHCGSFNACNNHIHCHQSHFIDKKTDKEKG